VTVSTGGELKCSIARPVPVSIAWRLNVPPETLNMPPDAAEVAVLLGVIETYASLGSEPGANVKVAFEDVTVPPVAALISTEPAGGPRALPGVAAGSGGASVVLVSVVAPSDGGGEIAFEVVVALEPLPVCGSVALLVPEVPRTFDEEPEPAVSVEPVLVVLDVAVVVGAVEEAPVTASAPPLPLEDVLDVVAVGAVMDVGPPIALGVDVDSAPATTEDSPPSELDEDVTSVELEELIGPFAPPVD
jgi:hypothetical protein